ncbi:uncharacterized protein [Euphorbia lathyris]|uniref:uncharacterized protein n=1 Tax=Euphorbia lathyris TaxID=212925 RepID=UPI003313EA50
MGELHECNEIYIPILHSSHFILPQILIDKRVVEVWDSLALPDRPIFQKNLIVDILRALDMGFKEQLKSKPADYNFVSFKVVRGKNVPRQPNNFDCGVFVILFMIKHCQFHSSTFQFNSNKERCRIAWWIAKSDYNKIKTELLEKVQSFI